MTLAGLSVVIPLPRMGYPFQSGANRVPWAGLVDPRSGRRSRMALRRVGVRERRGPVIAVTPATTALRPRTRACDAAA
jgi:hypothetical protein